MPDPRIWPIVSSSDGAVEVPNTSVTVMADNPDRADADLVNDSDYIIYLARGNVAVVGSGIRLNSQGGSYHIGTNNLFTGQVNGISTAPEQVLANLAISEGSSR